MLFNSIVFSALASSVLAATVQLTAQGNGINAPVTFDATGLTLNNGPVATIDIQEPSGFSTVNGQLLALTPGVNQVVFTNDQGQASKDFGVTNGLFRFGPSSDNTVFFACPAATGYDVSKSSGAGCVQVQLAVGVSPAASSPAASPVPSSSQPAASSSYIPASSSHVPVSSSHVAPAPSHSAVNNGTTSVVTRSSTTTDVITSCGTSPCTPVSVSLHNGAAPVAAGVGAAVLAGVAALL